MKVVGKRIVRTEVEFEHAKLKVKQIVQQVAKCTVCDTEGAKHPNCHFQKATLTVYPIADYLGNVPEIYDGTSVSPAGKGMVSGGVILPRNNMANWTIRCSQEWLEPVYWRIHEHLMKLGFSAIKKLGRKPAVNLSSGSYAVPPAKIYRQRSFIIPSPGRGILQRSFWRNFTDIW